MIEGEIGRKDFTRKVRFHIQRKLISGAEFIEEIMDRIRQEMESTACPQGIMMMHSLGNYHEKNKLKIGFETGSNLSLGVRLTRVKRLSRRRRGYTISDRCQEGSRLTKLSRIS